MIKELKQYEGFEQGPIRPPSEAESLLLRLTRNCPWNFCTFCTVYKGTKFSLRSVNHIKKDIDIVSRYLSKIQKNPNSIDKIRNNVPYDELSAFQSAYHWFFSGMESIFLQDANSLIMKPEDFIEILKYIKKSFPMVKRITSYARSHTISRIKDEDIEKFSKYGLNRVHIGLESGSDKVLKFVKKGATQEIHIKAGKKIKKAGIELSEYFMPGLGGMNYSKENALETAYTLNQINPDFIRLRTFSVLRVTKLFGEWQGGDFKKCDENSVVEEIKLFIQNLDGITSILKSDHMLNLFQDLEGKFPEDKEKMINYLDTFLDMDEKTQMVYKVGRRMGYFTSIYDMEEEIYLREKIKNYCTKNSINPENVEKFIAHAMRGFI